MDGTQHMFVKTVAKADGFGRVYVAGATRNGNGDYDLLVMACTEDGTHLWSDQYNGTGNGDDMAAALTVAGGKIYVTGRTYSNSMDTLDVITIGYDTSGTRDWVSVYAGAGGGADEGKTIAVDTGEIYVGGTATGTGKDFLGLRYGSSGTLIWSAAADYAGYDDLCTGIILEDGSVVLAGAGQSSAIDNDFWVVELNRADGTILASNSMSGSAAGFDNLHACTRDASGNIFLTGSVANGTTGYDVHTVKLDTNLGIRWQQDYSSSGANMDEGKSIAVDASGNVHVGGYKATVSQGTDFLVLQYDASGSLNWDYTLNGEGSGNDTVKAVALDDQDRLHLTGTTWNGSNEDYLTLRLSSTGTLDWQVAYNNKYNYGDRPTDITFTGDGGVVVTGQSMKPGNKMGHRTIKYFEPAFVMPVDTDSVSTSLRWIANHDQLKDTAGNPIDRVKYYSNQTWPNLYFMEDTLSYVFARVDDDTTTTDTMHRIDLSFTGANTGARLLPKEKESYWHNYYLGHAPEGRPFVPLYKYLFVEELWDGIDLAYSSNQRGLKYYFIVKRGTDPEDIALKYAGQDTMFVTGSDQLRIVASIGEILQPQALAYEMDNSGTLTPLNWQPDYSVSGSDVTFTNFGHWHPLKQLVIEVNWGYSNQRAASNGNLYWSTFAGGSDNDYIHDTQIADDGSVVVVGKSESADMPNNLNLSQLVHHGSYDAVAVKFQANRQSEWITFIGGSDKDSFTSLALTGSGVFCVGSTISTNMAVVPASNPGTGFYEGTNSGNSDGIFARLNFNNGIPSRISYFGSTHNDEIVSCTADASGNVFFVGNTGSYITTSTPTCDETSGTEFPLCNSLGGNSYFQNSSHGLQDIFLVKMNANNDLLWSTFFGSNSNDRVYEVTYAESPVQPRAFAQPSIIICGKTSKTSTSSNACSGAVPSTEFPLCDPGSGAFFQAGTGAFVSRFTTNGELVWSTNVNNIREFQSVSASKNEIYLAGIKDYSGQPASSCSPQSGTGIPICTSNGGYDSGTDDPQMFLAQFSSYGNALTWSTLFGQNGELDMEAHYLTNGNVFLDMYSKYLDVTAHQDGHLFVLGSTKKSFDPYLNGALSSWYYQDQNYSFNGTYANEITDAFIIGFDENVELQWSTFFGAGGGNLGLNFPFMHEFGTAIALKDDKLFISGYAGSDMFAPSTSKFPFENPGAPAHFSDGSQTLGGQYEFDAFLAEFDVSDMTAVSIEEEKVSYSGVTLYPNPANHSITVIPDNGTVPYETTVFDINGKVVLKKLTDGGGKQTLNLASIPSGIYLVRVDMEGLFYHTKFVKQ